MYKSPGLEGLICTMLIEESGEQDAKTVQASEEVIMEMENLPPQIEPTLESSNECVSQAKQDTTNTEDGFDVEQTKLEGLTAAKPYFPMRGHVEKCIKSHCCVL